MHGVTIVDVDANTRKEGEKKKEGHSQQKEKRRLVLRC